MAIKAVAGHSTRWRPYGHVDRTAVSGADFLEPCGAELEDLVEVNNAEQSATPHRGQNCDCLATAPAVANSAPVPRYRADLRRGAKASEEHRYIQGGHDGSAARGVERQSTSWQLD
jgi:hypothetical protein